MFCQKCGGKNDNDARFCVSCGDTFKKSANLASRKWLLSGILISLVVLIGVSYVLLQIWSSNKVNVADKSRFIENTELVVDDKRDSIKPVVAITAEKDKTIVIKEAMPKVFTIFTEGGLGSGFLYKKGGFIITNAHVVAGYTDVIVRNSNGKDTPGKVIGLSDRYDIALIRANDYVNVEPLSIELNESQVGSEVIAIGSPQGFENTASIGYLTGIGRDIEYGFIYENAYQIDAQIDHGSSGGPLLDAKTGKVIGINSLAYTNKASIGFSIPLYTMLDLVNSWAKNPMNEREVAGVFPVYEDYVYTEEMPSSQEESNYEEDVDESDSRAADSYYDDYVEEQETGNDYDESSLESFIINFRSYYEMALNDEDFYWVEDMVLPGSLAYTELKDYIAEITGQGFVFNFISNTVTDINYIGETAVVTTLEAFEFISATGESSTYERTKSYTTVFDDFGYYQITEIIITN